jgi:hypothetical protein
MPDEVKGEIVFQNPADIDPRYHVGNKMAHRGGRPKGPATIVEALKQELARDQNAVKSARNLIRISQNEKRVNAAVIANKTIADYVDGKPPQALVVANVMDDTTALRLVAIAEMLGLGK